MRGMKPMDDRSDCYHDIGKPQDIPQDTGRHITPKNQPRQHINRQQDDASPEEPSAHAVNFQPHFGQGGDDTLDGDQRFVCGVIIEVQATVDPPSKSCPGQTQATR